MVFAADKISKVRELSLDHGHGLENSPAVTAGSHYRQCLRLTEDLLTDSALVGQLRTEPEQAAKSLAALPSSRTRVVAARFA